jgi:hypothetical protein
VVSIDYTKSKALVSGVEVQSGRPSGGGRVRTALKTVSGGRASKSLLLRSYELTSATATPVDRNQSHSCDRL